MKKLFSIMLVVLLAIGCFATAVQASGEPDDFVVIGNPAREFFVTGHEQYMYEVMDRYFVANGTTVTVLIKLPENAELDRSFYQSEYDWYEPRYFSDLTVNEDGYFEIELDLDSVDTTGYPCTEFQLYINQDYDPGPGGQSPDYLVKFVADEENLEAYIQMLAEAVGEGGNVTWYWIEDETPEDPTEEPEEPTVEPEEPTVEPEEPTAEPEEPTAEPEEPVAPVDPSVPGTGSIALVGMGIASIIAGGAVLLKKKEN